MNDSDDGARLTRRALLGAGAGTVALSTVGTVQADGESARGLLSGRCPDATLRPSMGHCVGASMEGCADDHPVTLELREAVSETLEDRYPDAGALLEAGFKPYFDTLDGDDDGWSHWLHPEYIGDDAVLDPERPESVLVDNDSWRSIGVMFIATRDGEAISPPPAVYEVDDDDGWDGPPEDDGDHHDDSDGDGHGDHDHGDGHPHGDDDHYPHDDHDHHPDGDPDRCSPWHYHAGAPGRLAWWYYRTVYEGSYREGELAPPCRTPCMMHVWTVDHPEGVYAHGGPPPEYREREPADDPGFDTDSEPGEDELGWDVLPDEEVPDRLPESFSLADGLGL
ncbi:hypothetical protein C491_04911 [Natronococcus amylolyticus DSM 10524]|uniref:Uncharacterized protein n=1 Tax=Natronococcus amylolyticus DSM 10524 TaxID=1227497 RepID=L9XD59_9EURY|nr:hypothetical protein [Natronococcus amylolyticus]ELY59680.1 hypothetical protein C491_04911 [Natronococcus amylolyticus DSM 10524]